MTELSGKRVLVVGLARSGKAAAEALVERGAEVVGFDRDESVEVGRLLELGVEVHLGREEEMVLQGIDLVVKSPGVPGETALVSEARGLGIPVWSEIELGARLLPNPILGVTGTNGKTTTSELLGEMFRAAELPVEVAGNVGRPLTALVGKVDESAWIVCELSSFQLEDVELLRPRIAVLLNLEPDHLDRHGTFEWYVDAKLRIFEMQTEDDVAVVPRDFGPIPGAARRVEFRADDPLPAEPAIPGEHNRENAAAATAAARAAGIPDDAIAAALLTFPGVPHRIELVRELSGVRYVNDSKATNVAAALRAIAALPRLAAARDPRRARQERELRYRWPARSTAATARISSARQRTRSPSALGDAGIPYVPCVDLESPCRSPRTPPRRDDVVLLSPACASFDQFRDFEARGDEFRRLVEELT